jgi:hypothetical protein
LNDKLICEIECKNFIGFSTHIRFKHKDLGSKGYYDLFLKKDLEGICANDGCNNPTSYLGLKSGYSRCCSYKCSALSPSGEIVFHYVKIIKNV